MFRYLELSGAYMLVCGEAFLMAIDKQLKRLYGL